MNVALTTWNGRISPVLDVARQVLLVQTAKAKEVGRRVEQLPGNDPWAQAAQLLALAPQVLICGAVSRPLLGLLLASEMRLIPFTAGNVEDVLAAWLAGHVPGVAWRMPGCGGWSRARGGLCRGRGRRGQGRNERAFQEKNEGHMEERP